MSSLRAWLRRTLAHESTETPCRCRPEPTDSALRVDATDCPAVGALASDADCRETVVDALRRHPRDEIRIEAHGCTRRYTPASVRLLTAAARFAERVTHHDQRLATLAARHPIRAGREARERAGPVAGIATETGLAAASRGLDDCETALRAYEGPSIAASRVAVGPPPAARLRESYDTSATTVRIYDSPDHPVPTYHLEPLEATFEAAHYEVLSRAATHLARGELGSGDHAHHAAVRRALDESNDTRITGDPTATERVDDLAHVLRKHTAGYGVLVDFFSDDSVSDVFVNAPADDTVLRVTVDDEPMRTNVCLTSTGAESLSARVRTESGRPFSRAAPLVDAVATGVGRTDRIRVAGVTAPVTDGTAFAFRAADDEVWRLPDLVANDTMPPDAAALLELAVERGCRILVAGPRGAGKTTLLAALLWALPPTDRVLLLEDTPELPVDALQASNRDALALQTATTDDGASVSPADALRAALRLGDGALVVGEVRGEEAAVLYEAMRVGANSSAVLGTIHGDGGESVQERVVNDLGVPRSSFAATDLVATVDHTDEGRRLAAIEEVTHDGFASLHEQTPTGVAQAARIRRGNSELVARLSRPAETYTDVRALLERRTHSIAELPDGGTGQRGRKR